MSALLYSRTYVKILQKTGDCRNGEMIEENEKGTRLAEKNL